MDRDKKISSDLQTLRTLCDEATSREERLALLEFLREHFFAPEHQVVFESISALLQRGSISLPRLRVHLNNRGFPDIDVENYFPEARTRSRSDDSPDKVTL